METGHFHVIRFTAVKQGGDAGCANGRELIITQRMWPYNVPLYFVFGISKNTSHIKGKYTACSARIDSNYSSEFHHGLESRILSLLSKALSSPIKKQCHTHRTQLHPPLPIVLHSFSSHVQDKLRFHFHFLPFVFFCERTNRWNFIDKSLKPHRQKIRSIVFKQKEHIAFGQTFDQLQVIRRAGTNRP